LNIYIFIFFVDITKEWSPYQPTLLYPLRRPHRSIIPDILGNPAKNWVFYQGRRGDRVEYLAFSAVVTYLFK
jgi:hypothetical protein